MVGEFLQGELSLASGPPKSGYRALAFLRIRSFIGIGLIRRSLGCLRIRWFGFRGGQFGFRGRRFGFRGRWFGFCGFFGNGGFGEFDAPELYRVWQFVQIPEAKVLHKKLGGFVEERAAGNF